MNKLIARTLGSIALAAVINIAGAQTYPTKPIRILTPEPGGSVDFTARLLAQRMSTSLGKQIVIDNRGGASGIIAAETVAHSSPDGYTLLLYGPSIWLLPYLRGSIPYDFNKDFIPIILVATTPNILVVHPSLDVKSVKELIDLAKARPGQLNYGSGSSGGSAHLAPELFKSMTGTNIVRVAYKGVGLAVNDLVGGQVQLMVPPVATGMPHIKAGRLRGLGVTSARPSVLAPGIPPIALTVPGYESVAIYGMFAPAHTPAAIITKLNQEAGRFLSDDQTKTALLNVGVEPGGGTPQQFIEALKSDMQKTGGLITSAGIRTD